MTTALGEDDIHDGGPVAPTFVVVGVCRQGLPDHKWCLGATPKSLGGAWPRTEHETMSWTCGRTTHDCRVSLAVARSRVGRSVSRLDVQIARRGMGLGQVVEEMIEVQERDLLDICSSLPGVVGGSAPAV